MAKSRSIIFYTTLILLLFTGCANDNIVTNPNIEPSLSQEFDRRLEKIVASKPLSSNPFDYIKDNKDYQFIIQNKDKSLEYLLYQLKLSKEDGLKEYIMAIACNEMLGWQSNMKIDSGKAWLKHFQYKIYKD